MVNRMECGMEWLPDMDWIVDQIQMRKMKIKAYMALLNYFSQLSRMLQPREGIKRGEQQYKQNSRSLGTAL